MSEEIKKMNDEEVTPEMQNMKQEIEYLKQNERIYQETIIRLAMKLAGTL